jgi:hypothetical protein
MVHVEQLARRDRRHRSRRGGLADPRNGWLALAAAVGVLLLVQALVSVMA